MGWSYSFWRDSFYPRDLAPKDFLSYYAKKFNTVEVNSTFYRVPSVKTISELKNQTPRGFLFSLKFPQKITHFKMLKDCQEDTKFFLESVGLLEEKLGALLLQFPPMFGQGHLPLLREYLTILDPRYRYAVEVRNKSLLNEDFNSLLKEFHIGLVWVDSQGMCLDGQVTSDFIYIRWEGDRKKVNGSFAKTEIDQSARLKEWVNRLKPFLENRIPFFGYFSKYFSGYPPQDAADFIKYLIA